MATAMETMAMLGTMATTMKGLIDSANGIATLVDNVKAKAEVAGLLEQLIATQNGVLEIQDRLAAIITENDELKQQAMKFEAWETEKSHYELKEIAPRVYAYINRQSGQAAEPAHYLCCRCYGDRKKSILQFNLHSANPSATCFVCHAVLHLPSRSPRQTRLTR